MNLPKRILGATFLVLGTIPMVHAGCAPTQWLQTPKASSDLQPMIYRPGSTNGRFVQVNDERNEATIIGLWKFEMLSQSTSKNKNPMPDGTLIDFGTAAWHGDGTEFQSSGMRNPSDGDVCQGVWKQIGASTFQLNHYALAWTSGGYTGPVNIRATVRVNPSGDRYSGAFETNVYLASVSSGQEFEETSKIITITGSFTATRVTINN